MPDRAWTNWLLTHGPVRAVDVRQAGPGTVVVGLRGAVGAKDAQRAGRALAHLLAAGPREAHIDLAHAGALPPSSVAAVFLPLGAAARDHDVAVTVHRAGPSTRAALRALGLDRFLAYSDETP
ncbi:hypothetical protein GCM10010495_80710 [Kitasatospora herbaricolor]|uniref:STAS domain-containing protein n=1 Tax=Kitasatospora herbaricolor TaxID=68217 RepID=UPI00174819E3|nr:hypothetical protein [Kitasatospora herbaricolor]MDQ0306774.1 hypothetical protein [Kitasatospora herbaricolor]GGV50931.1 hypothetical protein GCM10010495_80710 [Kitasatospora herbaricolor]